MAAPESFVDLFSQPNALAHILAHLDSITAANLGQISKGAREQTSDASVWCCADKLRFPERLRELDGLNQDPKDIYCCALRLQEYLTAQAPLPHPLSRGGALLTAC